MLPRLFLAILGMILASKIDFKPLPTGPWVNYSRCADFFFTILVLSFREIAIRCVVPVCSLFSACFLPFFQCFSSYFLWFSWICPYLYLFLVLVLVHFFMVLIFLWWFSPISRWLSSLFHVSFYQIGDGFYCFCFGGVDRFLIFIDLYCLFPHLLPQVRSPSAWARHREVAPRVSQPKKATIQAEAKVQIWSCQWNVVGCPSTKTMVCLKKRKPRRWKAKNYEMTVCRRQKTKPKKQTSQRIKQPRSQKVECQPRPNKSPKPRNQRSEAI